MNFYRTDILNKNILLSPNFICFDKNKRLNLSDFKIQLIQELRIL